MTQLVEDRNRGLALGEANRLAREVSSRSAVLDRRRGAGVVRQLSTSCQRPPPATSSEAFPSGVALMDASGQVLDVSHVSHAWTETEEARVLAARSSTQDTPQYESHFAPWRGAAPADRRRSWGTGERLLGAVPAAALGLTESGGLIQTETHGTAYVIDSTGRVLFTQAKQRTPTHRSRGSAARRSRGTPARPGSAATATTCS